ncbi:hypothetical protein [Actinobacillus equuli]|uniref:hypothetical protein n=1 Tax=Actinobacillus equuli TaxID=718 RepID=UPI002442165E|nr:hypothetical protein [Actinobacillus equuli]WGE76041.1 type VI secretion system ImpA family N-terminal domain-containing protein [Actinobacillus equuli subsp. haemolyticus]
MKYQDILRDINGDAFPVGIPDEEGDIFSTIDEQVMKFGSLQHDSIDWDVLIASSRGIYQAFVRIIKYCST